MSNYNRWQQAREQGLKAANRFEKICLEQDYLFQKSTRNQDMKEHWDYEICKDDKCLKVEVKSAKRLKRGDAEVLYSILYLEHRNVSGNLGWLYGKADLVAFEQKEGFILIGAAKLVELWEKLVDKLEFTKNPKLYKSYRRKDRPGEHVSLILVSDILKEKHIIWTEKVD